MDSVSRSRSKAVFQNLNRKGCRVTITIANDENSTITGVVHSVDQTFGKLTLKNVSTGGVKLCGPQIYYTNDILDLQVVSDVTDESDLLVDNSRSKSSKGTIYSKKMQPSHLSRLRNLDDDSLVLSNILRDELGDQGIGSEEDEFEDFYVTEKYTLICRVCDKFNEAIEYIMQQEAVGVVVDGQKLGRDGTLSLVQIATDCELIIFDILRLGDDAFKSGLQAVFEAEDVMKVIHDCRWISDLLKYQHNISMANIFDTQVASAFVYRTMNDGDWPRYVESLPVCLIRYLKLAAQDIQFTQVRERCKETDEAVWLVRPLPEKLLEAAVKNTPYLLRLQQFLLIEMLAEFRAGVGIYLNHVTGTVADLEKCRVNRHLLPVAFTYIQNYTTKRRNVYDREDPRWPNKDGFRENDMDIPTRSVVFSHDSIWHLSHHSHEKVLPFSRKTETQNYANISGVPAEEKGKSRRMNKNQQQNLSKDKTGTGHKDSCALKNNVETQNLNKVEATAHCDSKPSDVVDKPSYIEEKVVIQNNQSNDTKSPSLVKPCGTLANKVELPEQISKQDSTISANTQQVGQIQNSMLWKMCGESTNQAQITAVKLPTTSSQDQGSEMLASPTIQKPSSTGPVIYPANEISEDEEEDKEAKELKRQMALLDQLHFVPATVAGSSRNSTIPQKQSSGHQSDSSSSSMSGEYQGMPQLTHPSLCDKHAGMPQLIKASQLSACKGSSDSDGSPHIFKPSEANLKREKNFTSAFMPAGMQESKQKSKKKGQGSRLDDEPMKVSNHSTRASLGEDLDFSLIPTPQSLTQRKEHALGMSPIGMGNPFSEDEGFCTPSNLLKSRLVSSQNGKEDSISDVELDMLLKSDKSQKILKLASLKPSTNVKDKILPFPVKGRSQTCDHS